MAKKQKRAAAVTILRRGKETWAEGERLALLALWYRDGRCAYADQNGWGTMMSGKGLIGISIGRTDSRTRLGFVIEDAKGNRITDFTLSREQVKMLRSFCAYQLRRLRKAARRGATS